MGQIWSFPWGFFRWHQFRDLSPNKKLQGVPLQHATIFLLKPSKIYNLKPPKTLRKSTNRHIFKKPASTRIPPVKREPHHHLAMLDVQQKWPGGSLVPDAPPPCRSPWTMLMLDDELELEFPPIFFFGRNTSQMLHGIGIYTFIWPTNMGNVYIGKYSIYMEHHHGNKKKTTKQPNNPKDRSSHSTNSSQYRCFVACQQCLLFVCSQRKKWWNSAFNSAHKFVTWDISGPMWIISFLESPDLVFLVFIFVLQVEYEFILTFLFIFY